MKEEEERGGFEEGGEWKEEKRRKGGREEGKLTCFETTLAPPACPDRCLVTAALGHGGRA